MSSVHPIARDNAAYVQQGIDLLEQIDNALFMKVIPPYFSSSLGCHYRHVLDHYLRFLAGWEQGAIDYDARERDARLETDRAYAIQQSKAIMDALSCVKTEEGGRKVTVRMACGEHEDPSAETSQSTVERELQFLVSHTVHHYALIAILFRLEEKEPGGRFGVAPSTLRHEQQSRHA